MTKKVVIDAGHGGDDPGTIANGIVEKDYTLLISKYIKNRLDQLNIESSLTRDIDKNITSSNRPKIIQSFYGNDDDVIVISNHINAGGGDGAEVIYSLRNNDTLSKKIALELERSGQNVRKYYQKRLPTNPAKDYYYVLRDTPNNETVIVEYGFADSKGDDVSQIKNNWQSLAEAVVKAISEYIGVPYVELEDNKIYYTVKSGDTLWSIARRFGLTVNQIKEVNNLKDNFLSIGDLLYIPSNETKTVTKDIYTVKKGDTLYSIAKKYNLSVDELKSLNNLTNDTLKIGQKLCVSEELPKTETEYTVVKGDTLYNVANKFKVSVDNIKVINNLNNNIISIGQILKIPNSINNQDNGKLTYKVKKGDTLYSIAKIYNTSVNELKSLNNLKDDTLTIGEVLILPNEVVFF